MVDVTYLAPEKNQAILTAHIDALSRAVRETGVVSGNRIVPTTPASLAVTVEAGWIKVAGAPVETDEEEVTITTAHATLPRVDLICRDDSGTAVVIDGTAASIEDPKSLGAWRSYTSPVPSTSVPDGYVILGAVYVGPEATSIVAENIWMFAGGVGGLATAVSSPGSDNYPASEKAVATELALKVNTSDIQTTIGSPGSDSKVPSEKAVRTELGSYALSTKGVTNGDSHDHAGGDGAQIAHSNLSGAGSNSHTTIDNHIASTSNPHSVTAAQVGAPALAILTEQGDMVQRGASTWEATTHGNLGDVWTCGGHGANNAWSAPTGWTPVGDTWTYASATTITVPSGATAKYSPGMKIKITQTSTKFFKIMAVADTLLTVWGGTDYTLASAAITSPCYSIYAAPFGFPLDPRKWSITVSDTSLREKSNPVADTYYYSDLGSINITLPVGIWRLSLQVSALISENGGASADGIVALSTSTSSPSDNALKMRIFGIGYTGGHQFMQSVIQVTSLTTYYLIMKTQWSDVDSLKLENDVETLKIVAECAYP